MTLKEGKAPFLFEVTGSGTDTISISLLNGAERVILKGITNIKDTVFIPVEAYDAIITGVVSEDSIDGKFLRNYIDNDIGIPFSARYGKKNRFEPVAKPDTIFPDGKWDVLFIGEKGDTSRNVGIFSRIGIIVTGSILTRSGDLRFLEGIITENGFKLSAFSGLSPYLFEFKFNGNDRFEGTFFTARGKTAVLATKNNKAALADAYSLTSFTENYKKVSFAFTNHEGKMVSIDDERYKGKVVILSILGSWCPNCLDEMAFLAPWYAENHTRGVEIIGIAFERKPDPEYAKRMLTNLKKRYNTGYEVLFAGTTSEESKATALPFLTTLSAFPTTVFLDKSGKIHKIHTGFNGPATGEFYEEFKKDFNGIVNQLLSQNQ
jgi:thiol-disulfide isomerase/thioredoxin